MHGITSRASVLGTLVVAGLLVFVLAPAAATAAPVTGVSNTNAVWAYGTVQTVKVGPTTAPSGWIYQGNATLGYTVTVYENSTSSTTFELTIYRTMGLAYSVRFCYTSCTSPTQWANETFRAYETTATFANFTSAGTVYLNGTTGVPAVALNNSASFLHANVTESTYAYLPSAGWHGPHVGYLGANLVADAAVAFAPSLGLFPDELTPGTVWNATSAFDASGAASWSYYYSLERPAFPVRVGPVTGGSSLTATGQVSVQGAYPLGSVYRYDGASYPAIVLTVAGPFDVREGIIFIPTAVDIFGSTAQPWAGNTTGSANVEMATLDLRMGAGIEPRVIASSLRYTSAAANAASPAEVGTVAGSGALPAVASSSPVAQGTLQSSPESTGQAVNTQNCLTTGSSCPGLPGSSSHPLLGLIVVGGVVATVAVLISLGVVSRRRRTPPTVYPNAVLYPPGAASPSAPPRAPTAPASPPPPEDDPLDHLW